MANFCTECGKPLDPGTAFCPNCGTPAAARQSAQPASQQPAQPVSRQPAQAAYQQPARPTYPQSARAWDPYAAQAAAPQRGPVGAGAQYDWTRVGSLPPGYSERVNDPALLAAVAKQKRVSRRVTGIIIPIPLVGFAIYGLLSDSMEFSQALLYGAIVSVIFLISSLFGKRGGSAGKTAFEGVVVDKTTRSRLRRGGASGYTELITVVRTSAGEQKKIVERSNSRTPAWDYLQVGEQFRYHPEFEFPYELYEKSHATYIPCVVCQSKNVLTADKCKKCGAPLLK